MKSLIMGLFLLSISLGNFMTAGMNKGITLLPPSGQKLFEGPNYYWFFTGCMLITSLLYLVWSPFYRGQTYVQGESETPV